jgi:hypothetical protein
MPNGEAGMKTDKKLVIIALLICVIVIGGETAIYVTGTHTYSAYSDIDGNYSVYSSGSDVYSAILTDNGSFDSIDTVYIYYDETYASLVNSVTVEVGAKTLTQEYYVEQLINTLNYRGLNNITILNASELAEKLSGDSSSVAKGLVVLSGALPDTVYTGNSNDLILKWIGSGGSLYWAGNLLGAYYSTTDGLISVEGDYQALFLGTDCLNETDASTAYSEITDNSYCADLSLMNNDVRYGVNTSSLEAGTYLTVGFEDDGYSSITFVKCGNGMVCVMGGDYSNNQRNDLAAVMCAGLCYSSEEICCQEGSVTRTTVNGILSIPEAHGNLVVYIYLGGYFAVYGESFEFISR